MKIYKPTKKQKQAHNAEAAYLLFGGAVGGGKSAWVCNEAIYHCLKYPGARVFLARHELTSFKKTTYITLMDFLPLEFVSQHNKSNCFITFHNGSQIFYGGLGDDIRAIERLKSMELSGYGIDQAEETTESFFMMLNSRLRLKIPKIKYKAWLTSNPTSNWIRSRFIDKQIEDHAFIPALPNENPYLPTDYEEKLRKILPEELVKAWVEGDWDIIASENTVFKFDDILKAMKRKAADEGEKCLGVDVSRYGGDETIIAKKTGARITFEDIFAKKSLMETAGRVIQIAEGDKSIPIKIDSIGVGGGVTDRLKEQGFNVIEVVGSQKAAQNNIYKNRRAENYFNLRDMLPELMIPDDEKLRAQMMSIRYRTFSDGLLLIESKDELKRRGLTSPDRLDALVIACSTQDEGLDYQFTISPVSGIQESGKDIKAHQEMMKQLPEEDQPWVVTQGTMFSLSKKEIERNIDEEVARVAKEMCERGGFCTVHGISHNLKIAIETVINVLKKLGYKKMMTNRYEPPSDDSK